MSGQRADLLLVERGFFDSRAKAQAAIQAGLVSVDGAVVAKASQTLRRDAVIRAEAPHPYVSRGGLKLAAALDAFGIDPAGQACLDVGASTGGFTDVLLRRGARHVTAVDTGREQFHASLRGDPRIALCEGQDIRQFEPARLAEPPTLAVVDVSFISLKLVLPAAAGLLAPQATLIALVKPQFEVGKGRIGKGGIVRDEAARLAVLEDVRAALTGLGFACREPIESPVTGGDGNVEYLIAARRA